MISISGNILDYWPEDGVEDTHSQLAVSCCGYQKLLTMDLTRKRERGRVDYQLIYMTGGKGIFRFGAETREVTQGQAVVFSPHQPQHYSYYAKDGAEAYWIHFSGYGAHDYLEQAGLLSQAVYSVGMMDEAVTLFKRIIQELNMNKPMSAVMTTACLMELLALVGRRVLAGEDDGRANPHADIHRIIGIMHERYNQPLPVTDLAKECRLSLFRFIHKFKDVTGTTPVKYITGIRMNEAKRLLLETSLQIKEVASIVGYDNPLYFSRVFCSVVGMSPSQYREGR